MDLQTAQAIVEGGGTLTLQNERLVVRDGMVYYGDRLLKGETWAAGAPEPRAMVYRVCWENNAGGNCTEYDDFGAAWAAFTRTGDPVLNVADLEANG